MELGGCIQRRPRGPASMHIVSILPRFSLPKSSAASSACPRIAQSTPPGLTFRFLGQAIKLGASAVARRLRHEDTAAHSSACSYRIDLTCPHSRDQSIDALLSLYNDLVLLKVPSSDLARGPANDGLPRSRGSQGGRDFERQRSVSWADPSSTSYGWEMRKGGLESFSVRPPFC